MDGGSKVVPIIIPYAPRPLQRRVHDSLRRFNVLVCHRRFGKTVLSINELIKGAARCKKDNPRFAYIAPYFAQAKTIAWDYLKQFAEPIPGLQKNEAELRVDLPGGSRISLYGADNPDRLRGLYLDGVVIDEPADVSPRLWPEVIRPALADRKGWAVFIGTPKGRNDFWKLYNGALQEPEWYAAMFRASETGVVDAAELADAAKTMSPEQYAQEFECSFQAALIGAYYGKEMSAAEKDGRITAVPYDPRLPVYTAWDLGKRDYTSIWWAQHAGNQVRIIDFYQACGENLPHYAKIVKEKPYVYGGHILPHDVEVDLLGMEQTRLATLQGLGLQNITVLPATDVQDGINAARLMLPRCWFDDKKTAEGLECLRQYQKEWDERLKTFRPNPRHDWSSHAADAYRYLALGLPENVATKPIQYNTAWVV